MVKAPLLLTAIFVLETAGALLAQTPCSEAGSAMPIITIHIYNYAQVSRRRLTEAERATSRVLKAAGMATEWVTCPVSEKDQEVDLDCERRLLSSELVLNILPHPSKSSLQYGDSFGYAQVFTNGQFGHYAFVFDDRVEDFARGSLSAGQLLGCVAAHEIGHLLLGSNAHTLRGLMSARWDKDDLERLGWGLLLFSPAEAEQLRAGMQARCSEFRPTRR
jgi:hypothetical protein